MLNNNGAYERAIVILVYSIGTLVCTNSGTLFLMVVYVTRSIINLIEATIANAMW